MTNPERGFQPSRLLWVMRPQGLFWGRVGGISDLLRQIVRLYHAVWLSTDILRFCDKYATILWQISIWNQSPHGIIWFITTISDKKVSVLIGATQDLNAPSWLRENTGARDLVSWRLTLLVHCLSRIWEFSARHDEHLSEGFFTDLTAADTLIRTVVS